jgi:hypothetical protein
MFSKQRRPAVFSLTPALLAIVLVGQAQPLGGSLRSEIAQALQQKSLVELPSIVTFTLENWSRPDPESPAETHDVQSWEIVTNGAGGIRVKVEWPSSPTAPVFVAGLDGETMWFVDGQELVVADQRPSPQAIAADNRLIVAQKLLNQARHELARLPWSAGEAGPPSIRNLEPNHDNPRAVVNVRGAVVQAEFIRFRDSLVVRSTLQDDGQTSYKWAYANYAGIDEWRVPCSADFEQITDGGRTLQCEYRNIDVEPIHEARAFVTLLSPPAPEAIGPEAHFVSVFVDNDGNQQTDFIAGLPDDAQ